MNDRSIEARRTRMGHANAVMEAISRHGRRFFHHDGRVTRFELDERGRLWLVDKYTGGRIWMHGNHRWRDFSDGGTLRRLCEDLRDYVLKGAPVPAGHFGPWAGWRADGDLWGYGQEGMKALREELRTSLAIRPCGRRGISATQAGDLMQPDAAITGLSLTQRTLSLLMSGHLQAVRLPFVARRGWPDPAIYGEPDPKRTGFSAMTPVRHVEFRGWCQEYGPWSKFQPLDVGGGDLLWVREDWSVGACASGNPVEGVWPVLHAIDGTIDACGSHYQPEWGPIRPADTMPIWASRITLEVTSVTVTPLSATTAGDLERLGLTPDDNASDWDESHPDGPASSTDPLVLTARVAVHLENVLDHLARRPQKDATAVPDLICAEDA